MDDPAMDPADTERNKKTAVAARALAAVVVFSVLLIGSGIVIVACNQQPEPVSAKNGKRAADKVYVVRGEVRMLPSPKKPTSMLVIRHEPIDEFENPDGSRGMAGMEMPLAYAADVALDGLVVGNKVEFDLSVWYANDASGKKMIESYRVTRMKKLPDETKIREGAAVPTLGN
jgi:hypothetical protein